MARAKTGGAGKLTDYPASTNQGGAEHLALSNEERRIIAFIVRGYTNKDMARHFSRSPSTIHRKIARVLYKLGASNRFELVLLAVELGILSRRPNNTAECPSSQSVIAGKGHGLQ